MISVMIVDDHKMVRQGIRAFLSTQEGIKVVAEASSGDEVLLLTREHLPDVILMDLKMPGLDGVEATRRAKQAHPSTQVIVLTSYHQDEHIFPAIRAGALSYLLKDVGPDELANAVRMAAKGEAILHPRVAARVIKEVHGSNLDKPSAFTELSDREMEVLKLIAEGMNNAQLAEALGISEKTVKSHVSNILAKLQLTDRTQAAVYAWREGVMRQRD